MQVMARSLKASVLPWKSSTMVKPSFNLANLTTSGTEKLDKASVTRAGEAENVKKNRERLSYILFFSNSKWLTD